jgi:hypothetical protein
MKMKNLKLFAAVSALAFLAGCASSLATPEQTLEERSQARWDHIFAEEYPEALTYYTPGYRQITSPAEYEIWVKSRPVRWTGAEVRGSECESEDQCTVIVNLGYRVPAGPTGIKEMQMQRDVREPWIRLDGQWFYARD